MKIKEKAKELVDKFSIIGLQQRNEGVQCALIAVDEIIKGLEKYGDTSYELQNMENTFRYWDKVKQEIRNL